MPRVSIKTEDFGQKIGGARKDLWATRGIIAEDLLDMTDYEKKEYVNKNNIWKKPDYEAMLSDGIPREVIYYIKLVRDALPAKITVYSYSDQSVDEQYKAYIDFIQEIKGQVASVRTTKDIEALSDYLERSGKIVQSGYRRYSVAKGYYSFISNKLVNVMDLYVSNIHYYRRKIHEKQFLYSDRDKIVSKYNILQYDASAYKNTRSPYNNGKETVMWGVPCSIDDNSLDRNRVGIPLPNELYERLVKEINDGEYLVLSGRSFVAITQSLEESYEKCFEHYKVLHPSEGKETEPKKNSRKKSYIPPQLRSLDRTGPVWRYMNKDITGDRMIDDFGFRGGEFGNWLSENDRKQSMNFCYDALMDLSYALGMQPTDVTFEGSLAIAFGSRGKGGARSAVAHYEPARQVINLTKMKGAGSLAHEWIHAMDHAVANYCANYSEDLASKSVYSVKKQIPEEFFNVITTIKSCTNYINAAKELDKNYGSDSQGYWQSDCELLARAGACWIHDRLTAAGIKNDYLCGHAEGPRISPHGEERALINQAFNLWLEKAKEIGLFNQEYLLPRREQDMNINLKIDDKAIDTDTPYDPDVTYTQISFFDLPEINSPELSEDIEI